MTGEKDATDGTTRSDGGDLTRVASTAELDPGERVLVEVDGKEIAVFNVDGEYYALLNYCVHQGGPLCEGGTSGTLTEDGEGRLRYERKGEIVTCPWHAWEFDITTGEHLARPEKYRVPTYDVVVRDGDLFVAV